MRPGVCCLRKPAPDGRVVAQAVASTGFLHRPVGAFTGRDNPV